jgi:streptogramin lyase
MSRITRWHQGGARLTWASSIGCALLVLLCVAVSSAVAGATDSNTEGLSFANQQLGASLVLPSVDQLVGGEQAQLVRTARRSAPAAVARRAASRSAFESLSSRAALAESARAFPALAHSGGGVPQLAAGERIVRYPTTHAAQVSLPGGVGVIEAIEPIASTTAHGAHVPFDLALAREGHGYAPVRSPVELSVPSALSLGVELPQVGVSLVPIDRRGVALAASAGQPDGAAVLWNAGAGVHDLATLAKASPRGFDLSTLLFSQRSPSRLYFRVGMPAGARLEQKPDGAVWIVKGRQTIAVVSPVSAEDAEGTSVPTSVSVSGDVISVQVDTGDDYLYPIAVDPEVNDPQLAKTTAGKRSNWEFHTSSAHFSSSESNGGPGAELLEAKGSGGYGPSEYGFWGYQTKGVSHVYEIKTETSAHNSGAKVESFLEFEGPSGVQETKKVLSSPLENPEYERKAATLCAANASKIEECLPGSGKANNAVHFQQSTTGSSGTGFSDAMTQGIVSIAEPAGTHSATSYNTSSPTIEVEVEGIEGVKEKVKRVNALQNAANTWLSKHTGAAGGAIELQAADPGIGVSATKLEYESAVGVWTPLEEHNYLAENGCQGLQCYVSHKEAWTLIPNLPNGAENLRYRAHEAISGTESLTGEGRATVKVDTKKPHGLIIGGLPGDGELSERPYELTGYASDGEGSTIASSGVKSIALFVDGREVGTAGGSCTVANGECTAANKFTVNGAELGAGEHGLVIVAIDNAGNEARYEQKVAIRHSTAVALGPGSVDLQSGDFTLGATDVSMGNGLTVGRSYGSRDTIAGGNGALGPEWTLNVGNTESLDELPTGDVLLTDPKGKQTIFAALSGGKFESPPGDSNLQLTFEEDKATKQLAYFLKNPAADTSVEFTRPAGTKQWVPTIQEGAKPTDTVTYAYETHPAVNLYSIPGSGTFPEGIVGGPDGNEWFVEHFGNKIGKVNPTGTITTYATASGAEPRRITTGPDGNLWFSENAKKIGRITPSGRITEFPTIGSEHESMAIATGPNGWVWFSEPIARRISEINPSATNEKFTRVNFSSPAVPGEMALGPDGNMWVILEGANKIAKVPATGAVAEFSLPAGSNPADITAGPGNSMWFTNAGTKKIGKITMAGEVTEYALPAEPGGTPGHIAKGPDGNVWFTAQDYVGKVTPTGEVSEYLTSVSSGAVDIASGADGNMWFTNGEAAGSIAPPGEVARPYEVRAPSPPGVSCSYTKQPTEMNPGCRALEIFYSTTPGAEHLTQVSLVAYNPVAKKMEETAVQRYEFDSSERLVATWDPRISPSLKTTYGYDEEGHVMALSAPGQEPWMLTYGAIAGDKGTGRLLKVARAPASAELWKGEAVANTEAPKITGSVIQSATLSASNGKWSGSPNAYSYQWRRCASAGSCVAIAGATNPSYKLQAADAGDTILVTVRATNAGGSASSDSVETAAVKTSAALVTEYSLPAGSNPKGIAPGPASGTLWFADYGTNKISKTTSSGTITEYALPAGSGPVGIVKGPDSRMWFTDYPANKIGAITATGTVSEYAVPAGSSPWAITEGPDGNLWFTNIGNNKIDKITPTGTITEYSQTAKGPNSIVSGPDGNLWFTDGTSNKIGKITTSGTITEYSLPAESNPKGIAVGPDGNLWFTDGTSNKIGKITTSGTITEYSLPIAAELITSASGYLWVAGRNNSQLVRVTTSGAVSEFALPTEAKPERIAVNSLGELWYTATGDKLGKIALSSIGDGEARTPEPGTTINYGVPVSGAGAPYKMSESEVARWGQSDDPVEATAITAADEPQGWPASGYKRAGIYYLDEHGRQVNFAAPSTAPNGSISTTEYNEFNDSIRTLSADNRLTALASGSESAEKSKLLDTQYTYNGEGKKEREVEEAGTRLIDMLGPQHTIKYRAGGETKESLARHHEVLVYDQGAPGGEKYDLVTEKYDLAQLVNHEEVEVRTTKTSYSGQSNLGWELRSPTSSTVDPEGLKQTTTTEYSPTTGQVTEVRGAGAETTLSYATKFGEAGTEAGKLKNPWGVAVNSEGKLLVADSANNRIEQFTAAGAYISSFGTAGSGNGQLGEPEGIALDSSGHIWVADTGNNRVEEFSATGTFMATVGALGTESGKFKSPAALAFDAKGNMWVADSGNSRVEKFNKEGVYSSEFGSAGSEPGKLAEPKGIAVDSGEHVWVADTANNRIQEFSSAGTLLKRFGSPGAGEGQLNTPVDLKIDSLGNIWTVDSLNSRAESFTPSGAYVTQIGWKGTEAGQLTEPRSIAFDATGKAWVADSSNNRLEQFSKGPNAHDSKTIYYGAAANSEYPACGSHPEWAGLVCETLPAKQPELMGLPKLPVTSYIYNMYDEPETIAETFGSTTRTKTETYDAAGRRSSSEVTASTGVSLPKVSFTYNPAQGMLEKQTTSGEERTLTGEFNRLGQPIKYTDGDGNVAKYTYAGPENDFLLTEASDSSAAGTSKQSYEYEATTKLRTKLIDSAAGSFTASYDAEGKLSSVSYPYGMCATDAYNSVGEATSVRYLKTSNCSESEPGIYYSDTRLSSVRGELLSQSSTLASESYSYDASGRLTETQETPAGEGCTVRAYVYDEEANRASSATRTPGTGGACQAEGGTTEAHNYDEANRLADGGMSYDGLGNVTKLPAADAEGHELTSSFYVDNAVASQTQNGVTNQYKLDPEGRTREAITGSTKTINHYDGSGEAVAWSESPEKWVRNIPGLDGTLLATQTNGGTPVLQLHDLQGDVVGTIGDKAGETKLLSSYNSTEFGVPNAGKAPPKFAYLGALGVESSFSTGVITYGATSYVPQTGRALQSEAVEAPGTGGGSGAGAPYTMQEEPWNMQGAAREAAEAPGLEAAREQTALEAAFAAAQDVDPHELFSLADARIKGEQFLKIATAADIINAIGSIPDGIVEKVAGLIWDKFSVDIGLDWFHKAGQKLVECSHLYSEGFRRCNFGYTNTTLNFLLFSVTFVNLGDAPEVEKCAPPLIHIPGNPVIWRCERLGEDELQT